MKASALTPAAVGEYPRSSACSILATLRPAPKQPRQIKVSVERDIVTVMARVSKLEVLHGQELYCTLTPKLSCKRSTEYAARQPTCDSNAIGGNRNDIR